MAAALSEDKKQEGGGKGGTGDDQGTGEYVLAGSARDPPVEEEGGVAGSFVMGPEPKGVAGDLLPIQGGRETHPLE